MSFGNKQALFAQALNRYGIAKLSGLNELSDTGSPRARAGEGLRAIGAGGMQRPLRALSLLTESALWIEARAGDFPYRRGGGRRPGDALSGNSGTRPDRCRVAIASIRTWWRGCCSRSTQLARAGSVLGWRTGTEVRTGSRSRRCCRHPRMKGRPKGHRLQGTEQSDVVLPGPKDVTSLTRCRAAWCDAPVMGRSNTLARMRPSARPDECSPVPVPDPDPVGVSQVADRGRHQCQSRAKQYAGSCMCIVLGYTESHPICCRRRSTQGAGG